MKTPSGNTEEDGNAVSMPDRAGFGPVLKPILVSARAEATQKRRRRPIGRAEAMPTQAEWIDQFRSRMTVAGRQGRGAGLCLVGERFGARRRSDADARLVDDGRRESRGDADAGFGPVLKPILVSWTRGCFV